MQRRLLATGWQQKVTLVIGLSLVLGACADQPTAPSSSITAKGAPSADVVANAQTVARGIALALSDASIRAQVRDAMRGSLLNEHKLVLQDFAETPAGQALISAASAALNLAPASLKATITGIPRLDFYASFQAHRLGWKATPDIHVASIFDADAPTITAYGTDGGTVTLRQDMGTPNVPLFVLHPEEPKLTRDAPQADLAGDVIEEPTDGGVATKYVAAGSRTNIVATNSANASASVMASNTYINHYNIQEGDGWFGDSEMQFHSSAIVGYYGFVGDHNQYLVSDAVCPLGSAYRNGVVEDRGYDGLVLLSPGVTNVAAVTCNGQGAYYGIHIIEIDGGGTGENDDFGWRFYTAGPYPFGATVGTVYSFYTNTWDTVRSAYLRIVYN